MIGCIRWLRVIEPFVSTLAICLAGALAGLALTPDAALTPTIWPPAATAIGLILRRRHQPALMMLGGAVSACLVVNLGMNIPADVVFGLTVATIVEIVLAVTLLGRGPTAGRIDGFDDLARVVTCVLIAVAAGTLLAASVLASATGAAPLEIAQRWFTASIVPGILVVPAILTCRAEGWRDAGGLALRPGMLRRILETVGLVLVVAAIAIGSVGIHETAIVAFLAAPLIWIALRFGIGPTAAASVLIGAGVMIGTGCGWWEEAARTAFAVNQQLTLVGLGFTTTSVAAFMVALTLRQLRESRALLAATVSAIPDPVVVYDRNQQLMLCNDATRAAFPQLGDLLVPGTSASELRRQGRRRGLARRARAASGDGSAADGDLEMELFDGRIMQARIRPVAGGGRLVIARDVSEWAERTRRAVWMAEHDALTGLPNRRAFDARLRSALEGGDRRHHAVLVLLDLDAFKPINDRHGHPVGDAVLREVGRRLASVLGPGGHAARLGGDEFAVLHRLRQPDPELRRLLERLRGALSAPMEVDGLVLRIGASLGHAMFWRDGDTADELLARADLSLYADKRARTASQASEYREALA